MFTQMRLAVDARNLAQDRRGMGRFTRSVLRIAQNDPTITLTLLARPRDHAVLRQEFSAAMRFGTPKEFQSRDRYDVIWFPFNGMPSKPKTPSLVTVHDVFAFTEPHRSPIARWREQQPIRRAIRHANGITTDSDWSKTEIARIFPQAQERTIAVPLAPDPFFFPARDEDIAELVGTSRFVLIVASTETRKNIALALAALRDVFAAVSDVQLVVVGNMNEHDTHALRFLGAERYRHIAADDTVLRALYRHASVVVVPSRSEGYGLVVAEAMACGAPIVTSNTSALPQTAGDAAVLVDPDDLAGWSAAIERILEDSAFALNLRAASAARFAFADRDVPARTTLAALRRVASS